jgi:hypothetical protein
MNLKPLLEQENSKSAEILEYERQVGLDEKEIKSTSARGVREKDYKRMGELHTRLAASEHQSRRLYLELTMIQEAIAEELPRCFRCYNSFVGSKAQEARHAFFADISKYYGGPDKDSQTMREFQFEHIPLVAEIERCAFDTGDWRLLQWKDKIETAKRFIAWVTAKCKERGWDLSQAESFQPAPAAAAPDPNRKVKVRVIQAGVIPALGMSDPNPKRKRIGIEWGAEFHDRVFKAGEVLEIPHRQYNALARFFELVDQEPTS